MNNRTLEIILKLRDELTQKMKGVEGSLKKFSAEVSKFAKDMKRVGSDISHVGSSMAMMGAVLTGPLLVAFNNAKQYSRSVSTEIDRLKVVSDSFQLSIAQAMLPVMQQFTNIIARLYQAWQGLGRQTQQTIVQGVLLTGIFMTLGGVILRIIGGIIKTGGTLIQLIQRITPMQIAVMLVVAAVALLIDNWEKCRAVVAPVLNTLEAGLSAIASGVATIVSLSVKPMAFLIGVMEKFVNLMAKIPGPQQQMFKDISAGLKGVRTELDAFSKKANQMADSTARHAVEVWNGADGAIVSSVDKISAKWQEMKDAIGSGVSVNIDDMQNKLNDLRGWSEEVKRIMQGTAQALSSTFSTLFFDAFSGQLKSAKEYFADFGKQILQILSQALAKMLLVKTIGKMIPGLGAFFHTGGVVYAHSGMLARDEVPIVAQTGERILSRRENREYERNVLGKGSKSRGGGALTIQIMPVIQAWDTSDVYRNRKAITSIIAEDIRNNSDLRRVIRAYD